MFCYTTTYINILSFVISIIVFFSINIFFSNKNIFSSNIILEANIQVDNFNNQTNPQKKEIETEKIEEINDETKDEEWFLEIPCINLKADIKEGTTKEVMDDYIGHFEDTQKEDGNIGLAAHNRGYKNNYFENIKYLKEGDRINYHYNGYSKEYTVEKQMIIKDTDWTNLKNTNENKITLITCVENQKEYRRCIQAKEIKKESEDN